MTDLPPPPDQYRLPEGLAQALSEHSPQVDVSAPALIPTPGSPTGWVLVRPMLPVNDEGLERLGGYLTAKHLGLRAGYNDTDVEGIVRTTIADVLLVLTGAMSIEAFAPPPPLPAEPPPRLILPPALRARVDAAREAVAAHTASDAPVFRGTPPDDNGRARDTVYAGIPHPYQAREGAIGYCDCGLPAQANIHAPSKWQEIGLG